MDTPTFIDNRRGRYLAQLMEEYERLVLPHLPDEARADSDAFKVQVRRKMRAMATDCAEIAQHEPGLQVNGLALQQRDQVHPHGRT